MNDKIKIAFLIDRLSIGGTEKQLLETIRRLDKGRFRLYLICLRDSKYFREVDIPAEKHVLGVDSLLSFNGFSKLIRLSSFFRKRRIDILQTFFFDSSVFGVIAGKIARVKKIVESRRDLGFWYTPKLLRVLKLVNPLADRFLVNSEAVKECVARYEGVPLQKIDVIYNGIEAPPNVSDEKRSMLRERLGITPSERVVGIVANLNRPVKRVDLFLRAAAAVSNKIKHAKFLIVGDGCLRKNLEELGRDLRIHDRVIFVGKQNDVWPYISLFDVGVLCSDSEGFSNSLLEYAAMGKPSVATDNQGNKEIAMLVGSTSIRPFACGDSNACAQAIVQVLNHYSKIIVEADETRAKVMERFFWKTTAEKINGYYEFILSNRLVSR